MNPAQGRGPNGMAAWLALPAKRLSGSGGVDQPQPKWSGPSAAWHACTTRGHHAEAMRAEAQWHSWRRWSNNPIVMKCGGGEPAMMCRGVRQHQSGRSSSRPLDDGGATDLVRGAGGTGGERSPVAAGDASLLLHHQERERNMRQRLIERCSGRRMGLTGEGGGGHVF
jgi:hypothetical protein